MAKFQVFKKCGCRVVMVDETGRPALDAAGRPTRRRLGAGCPRLHEASGWSAGHGTWHFQIEVSLGAGRRRQLSQGGIATARAAERAVVSIRRLLGVAEEFADDPGSAVRCRVQIAEQIQATLRDETALPDIDELRRDLRGGIPVVEKLTVGEWLTRWLAAQGGLTAGTVRCYRSHLELYLLPQLGDVRLDRLRVGHVQGMFAAMAEQAAVSGATEGDDVGDVQGDDDRRVRKPCRAGPGRAVV